MNRKAIVTTVGSAVMLMAWGSDSAYAGTLDNCTPVSPAAVSGAIVAEGRTTNGLSRVRIEVLATEASGAIPTAGCANTETRVCTNGACTTAGPTVTDAGTICQADPAFVFVGKENTGLTDFDCDPVGPISNCSVPNPSPRYVVKTNAAEKEAEPLIGNVVAVGFDLRGVLPTNSVQNPPPDQDFVDIYTQNATTTKVFENCAWVP